MFISVRIVKLNSAMNCYCLNLCGKVNFMTELIIMSSTGIQSQNILSKAYSLWYVFAIMIISTFTTLYSELAIVVIKINIGSLITFSLSYGKAYFLNLFLQSLLIDFVLNPHTIKAFKRKCIENFRLNISVINNCRIYKWKLYSQTSDRFIVCLLLEVLLTFDKYLRYRPTTGTPRV